MELHLLDRSSHDINSFLVNRHRDSAFLRVWHYHPELELVLILNSTGTRFVGDSIERFEPGQLVLLGKELPHMWMNDNYSHTVSNEADAIAIHFEMDFLGEEFFDIYEFSPIKKMLLDSKRGLLFEKIEKNILSMVINLPKIEGAERVIHFLMILNKLSASRKIKYLSSKGFMENFNRTGINKLDKVYKFIFSHFQERITLKKISSIADMNPSAFSRFFKRIHKKTFIRYLNEIRIGYACKMLIEQNSTISTISYDCGFNNTSNFNRQFKLIKGVSPSEFLHQHCAGKLIYR